MRTNAETMDFEQCIVTTVSKKIWLCLWPLKKCLYEGHHNDRRYQPHQMKVSTAVDTAFSIEYDADWHRWFRGFKPWIQTTVCTQHKIVQQKQYPTTIQNHHIVQQQQLPSTRRRHG
eukprot:335581_1